MDLKLYKCSISEDDKDDLEVDFISLVKSPAIKENFLAFNKQEKKLSFALNEDEQIITGLAMVADLPIYRNQDGEEFYTYFDAQTIKQIAQKFFRKKYNFNLNLNHSDYDVNDVYVFESWIVDRAKGKPPMDAFKDVADGSWFVSAKVHNAEIWQAVKAGEFQWFSIEGFFKMEPVKFSKQEPEMSEEDFDNELIKMIQESTL